MSEEQIVERVAREAFDVDRPDEWQMRRARAVLALLGPAPLVWGDVEQSGGYRRGMCRTTPIQGKWHTVIRSDCAWTYEGDLYPAATMAESLEAAKSAAEAHHRAQWFAGTVLGQEAQP